MQKLKLYVIPGSPPCRCVEAALEIKNIEYQRVDLLPIVHVAHQSVRFGKRTVPGVIGEGFKVVGSTRILRALESIKPSPSLLPEDPELLQKVQTAEKWGDGEFQTLLRRVMWPLLKQNKDAVPSYLEGFNLPLPQSVLKLMTGSVIRSEELLNRTGSRQAEAALKDLPAALNYTDSLVQDGVIGGKVVNVADLQIGSVIDSLSTIEDLAPLLKDRPSVEAAERIFPDKRGTLPAGSVPAEWLTS